MKLKEAKKELFRNDPMLRLYYYSDLLHQLKRLWYRIKTTKDKGDK
jgi:hypothetical protein